MRPNILLIFADQMRADTMGCAGHPLVQTPNLDRLAHDGVHFVNAYTPNPVCVPARATVTTGNYPHKCTGVKSNGGRIRDDQVKMAEFFSHHGYVSYASGKLHYVPYAKPGEPRLLHGFDRAALAESGRMLSLYDRAGVQTGIEDYHDFLKASGWAGYSRAHGIGNNDIHPAASPLPQELHVDAWVATQAMAFLDDHRRQHADKPFFMFMSFPKPHAPYDPPRPFDAMYDPRALPRPFRARESPARRTPGKRVEGITHGWGLWSPECHQVIRSHYAGLVTFQDRQIGRVLKDLEDAGQLDNTIVVYTADHGDLLGDFGFFAKSSFYRGSAGIPFLVHWPKALRRGLRSAELVGLQDVLPTLASLAGLTLPRAVDGLDLSPILRGQTFPGREFYVSYYLDDPQQQYMLATRRWKYMYSQLNAVEELYDLEQDPDELTNLAGTPGVAGIAGELRSQLIAWARENGDHAVLDGARLKARHDPDFLKAVAFQPGVMGWRWY